MKMPDLGPLIEQGISSVVTTVAPQDTISSVKTTINIDNANLDTITNYFDGSTTTAEPVTKNFETTSGIKIPNLDDKTSMSGGSDSISLVTTSQPVTLSSSPMVVSTNIDTFVTTTKLNIGDISVTTLSPFPRKSSVSDEVGASAEPDEFSSSTSAYSENNGGAINLDENLISDDAVNYETKSNSIQSNFITTQPSIEAASGLPIATQAADIANTLMHDTSPPIGSQQFDFDAGLHRGSSNAGDEEEEAFKDDNQQKIDSSIPLISVNDLIPELQDKELFQNLYCKIQLDFNTFLYIQPFHYSH